MCPQNQQKRLVVREGGLGALRWHLLSYWTRLHCIATHRMTKKTSWRHLQCTTGVKITRYIR